MNYVWLNNLALICYAMSWHVSTRPDSEQASEQAVGRYNAITAKTLDYNF